LSGVILPFLGGERKDLFGMIYQAPCTKVTSET
jgi:hypothetical protein